jgi:hypothetical protein
MLEIYAGKNALNTIQEHGFKQELFTNFLGASGGPKWFTLFGLDKYLFGEFFSNRSNSLNVVGSSAGAFRSAALCQNKPVDAVKRLAYTYANTAYSKKPTPSEISKNAIEIIDDLFAEHGAKEVVENKYFKAHFLVAKCNGLTRFDNKLLQGTGLLSSVILNKMNRRFLNHQYQRYIFKQASSDLCINDPYDFKNTYHDLTEKNIKAAVLASGSIPLIMSGVKDIQGAKQGTYRDGGIIDYHFDFSLNTIANKSMVDESIIDHYKNPVKCNKNNSQKAHGLTLYPHFSRIPKAGWFDKSSNRKVLNSSYNNTVLLAPSAKFINSLPFHKIPDRTDFTELDTTTRIKYWLAVLEKTDELAEAFHEFFTTQNIDKVKPFQP